MLTGSASLHAGMIERGRRRKVRVSNAPDENSAENVVRHAFPASQAPQDEINAAGIQDIARDQAQAGAQTKAPRPKRFGLTVRVEADLKTRLMLRRTRTGMTTQDILHDALTLYLDGQRAG